MSEAGQISVAKEDIPRLERLYNATPDGGTFMFKGQLLLKEYAKYVLEYVKSQFEEDK